jgi:membrane associated rhomboid family serine protease
VFLILPKTRRDPSSEFASVSWTLVAVNVVVYLVTRGKVESFEQFGFVPSRGLSPGLVTSMFIHADVWHLLGNMFFLAFFGPPVEDAAGHWKTLLLYAGAHLFGCFMSFAIDADSKIPMVGASGAICGLMGAYAYVYRRHKVDVSIYLMRRTLWEGEWPALTGVLAYLAEQALFGIAKTVAEVEGGVAYGGHVYGLVAGLAAGFLIARKRDAALVEWRRSHMADVPCPRCGAATKHAKDDLYHCIGCSEWVHGPDARNVEA